MLRNGCNCVVLVLVLVLVRVVNLMSPDGKYEISPDISEKSDVSLLDTALRNQVQQKVDA